MLILALDTTSREGSLAILRGPELLHEMVGDGSHTHGERLPLDFMRVSEVAGIALRDIELFAVAAGPGSFTGLRVGIAAIQGLAVAFNRRVVPVSTLDAVAAGAPADALVGAWVDAQRGEVFAQLFAPASSGTFERTSMGPASSAGPEAVLDNWRSGVSLSDVAFHGSGAVRYRDRIRGALGAEARVADRTAPLASTIGRIAANAPERAVSPHAIVPIYIRRPDAELARDRRRDMTGESPIVLERIVTPDASDLAAIVALESESFTNPWSPEALAAMLQSHATGVFVARRPTRGIVAFCACWIVAGELHINTLAVASAERRKGIATRLIRFVIESTGAERATLEVRESNTAALHLYQKLGFQPTAVRKDYYRNPDEDGLILWWNP